MRRGSSRIVSSFACFHGGPERTGLILQPPAIFRKRSTQSPSRAGQIPITRVHYAHSMMSEKVNPSEGHWIPNCSICGLFPFDQWFGEKTDRLEARSRTPEAHPAPWSGVDPFFAGQRLPFKYFFNLTGTSGLPKDLRIFRNLSGFGVDWPRSMLLTSEPTTPII